MKESIGLFRFTEAHRCSFQCALEEVAAGRKVSDWMWFIFPQIKGLGKSSTSKYYAIQSLDEARAFLNDSYLGNNLLTISNVLLDLKTDNPTVIFGKPDDMKLRSCMTLFASITDAGSVFHKVLDKFFDGRADMRTLRIILSKDT